MEYVSAVTPPEGRATALGIYTAAQMPAGTILANAIAVPALGAGSLRAVFLLFSAPVSYTHLDVYKRQP